MNKSVLSIGAALLTFCLMAFGFVNWNKSEVISKKSTCNTSIATNPDFIYTLLEKEDRDLFYNIDSRFINTITKKKLIAAKSIIDILPKRATQSAESFRNVEISILHDAHEKTKSNIGDSDVLNDSQLQLLQSTSYSDNIFIRSDYNNKNVNPGELESNYLTYYISILPEKEAEFEDGHSALINYLKENSKEYVSIIKRDKLKPGKVSFTVTKEGTIANIELNSTCGYNSVDQALVDLVSNIPEKWVPAENFKGEKIDQDLIFFFGLEGC